jgi:hypothetical protein
MAIYLRQTYEVVTVESAATGEAAEGGFLLQYGIRSPSYQAGRHVEMTPVEIEEERVSATIKFDTVAETFRFLEENGYLFEWDGSSGRTEEHQDMYSGAWETRGAHIDEKRSNQKQVSDLDHKIHAYLEAEKKRWNVLTRRE